MDIVTTDPDVTFMYVPAASCVKTITRQCLQVRLSSAYNRKTLPQPYESEITKTWQERMKLNPCLWNGTKFRIASVVHEDGLVIFNLGVTSYKEFIGTNWSPNAKLFRELGYLDHRNSQVYMSDALGVGAFLETADDQVVFLKRGEHLAEAAGSWDIPGGHPEPQALVGKIDVSEINIEKLSATEVVNEIFNSILNELVDEVNVPIESLSEPYLLGIARNTTSAGRPSSEYYIRCSLSASEILLRYEEGTQVEADETTAIMFLPKSEIAQLPTQNQLIWSQLAPSAKGCILLYNQQFQ